ncbi:MAG: type II secretion system protein [bacterium]|nr:type II secretion system protein [bacterium]
MKKNATKKGFTLIELLVVIAIIGMLSSIVFASLNDARKKGRVAQMQGSMRSIQTAAVLCMDDGAALTTPAAAAVVCTGSATTYGALPTTGGWSYGGTDLVTSDGTFLISATATGDAKTITCTESGCTTS